MVRNEQVKPQERLMTSSSLESPAEKLHCGKGEQQDSTTSETLHFQKGEQRRMPSSLHHLGKVNSEQSSNGQQRQQRQDCFQDWKSGVSAGQTSGNKWELLTVMEDSRPDMLSTWTVSGGDFLNNETFCS
ncbi:hypothetical protein STEG23_010709 [Scotinomys teguina]